MDGPGNGPTNENLLQRIETDLKPETIFAHDPYAGLANYAKSNGMDVVAPLIASLATGIGEEELIGLGASKIELGAKATKLAKILAVGATFAAEPGGRAYTQSAAAGGSDDDARHAANLTFAIDLLPNILAGYADRIPG